ncbi:hypothetical protein FRACYDRAFT_253753 [Fragilariopsis cylindrus CCMP1102]|uniref:Uncharacterized protein n=1 Tax=Fragilariopsis cylindrus CCMP1102 TaxID=635003 RepID=A0A1E7ELB0_9STRA|nr:hypothetical protein FRACYDRAFT_253753 [Fragilariopsis cylindrus CCMP1102]|eukprot:OEU06702.1 hypothetical protein FRACYDRAFT_253753 [Fragilariopsis cylindrus CCMP1102]
MTSITAEFIDEFRQFQLDTEKKFTKLREEHKLDTTKLCEEHKLDTTKLETRVTTLHEDATKLRTDVIIPLETRVSKLEKEVDELGTHCTDLHDIARLTMVELLRLSSIISTRTEVKNKGPDGACIASCPSISIIIHYMEINTQIHLAMARAILKAQVKQAMIHSPDQYRRSNETFMPFVDQIFNGIEQELKSSNRPFRNSRAPNENEVNRTQQKFWRVSKQLRTSHPNILKEVNVNQQNYGKPLLFSPIKSKKRRVAEITGKATAFRPNSRIPKKQSIINIL